MDHTKYVPSGSLQQRVEDRENRSHYSRREPNARERGFLEWAMNVHATNPQRHSIRAMWMDAKAEGETDVCYNTFKRWWMEAEEAD